MKRQSLIFTGPEAVLVNTEDLDNPGPGQLLVKTSMSAISPGTEMLIYRGQAPEDMLLDESIGSLGKNTFQFPFKYGYACVGRVYALGEGVDPTWSGKNVFSFNPHESAFLATPSELMEIPADISLENALFLPNMETAVNFLMDGQPIIGEAVAVFGLGVVGLLTTELLAGMPLSALVTFDRYAERRAHALSVGANASLDPGEMDSMNQALDLLQPGRFSEGADLVFEISGSPAALNQALQVTGYAGRVVIGSWYGKKPVELDLGGRFHRSRIRLISSQVSSVAPELSGRWSKRRRMEVAWQSLRAIQPARWITQRFAFEQAAQAYRLLAEKPQETLQVVLVYGNGTG